MSCLTLNILQKGCLLTGTVQLDTLFSFLYNDTTNPIRNKTVSVTSLSFFTSNSVWLDYCYIKIVDIIYLVGTGTSFALINRDTCFDCCDLITYRKMCFLSLRTTRVAQWFWQRQERDSLTDLLLTCAPLYVSWALPLSFKIFLFFLFHCSTWRSLLRPCCLGIAESLDAELKTLESLESSDQSDSIFFFRLPIIGNGRQCTKIWARTLCVKINATWNDYV